MQGGEESSETKTLKKIPSIVVHMTVIRQGDLWNLINSYKGDETIIEGQVISSKVQDEPKRQIERQDAKQGMGETT